LSNILRHAQASKVSLSIVYTPDEIQLIITDDGCSFDIPESPAEFVPNGHFGLLGFHERAELIEAHLVIQSKLEEGTSLQVIIPNQKETL